MSREIKFRGMDVNGGYMVYGSLLNAMDGNFIIDDIKVFNDPTLVVGENYAIHVHSLSVGQFTGLKDKNGVDVYESDIVRHGFFTLIICFMRDSWVAKYVDSDEYESLYDFINDNNGDIEVLGNIHEHPHLLGGKNA